MNKQLPLQMTAVYPGGRTEVIPLTPEQAAAMDAEFLKAFDPETLESRSMQEMRRQAARTSPPSPPPSSLP